MLKIIRYKNRVTLYFIVGFCKKINKNAYSITKLT
jgi:hypothetical protein